MSRKKIKKVLTQCEYCPFCGLTDWEPTAERDEDPPNHYVFCRNCGAGGPTGDDPEQAIEKFRTRHCVGKNPMAHISNMQQELETLIKEKNFLINEMGQHIKNLTKHQPPPADKD